MAPNGMISIGFKIEAGKGGLQNLVMEAKGLQKALDANVTAADKLNILRRSDTHPTFVECQNAT